MKKQILCQKMHNEHNHKNRRYKWSHIRAHPVMLPYLLPMICRGDAETGRVCGGAFQVNCTDFHDCGDDEAILCHIANVVHQRFQGCGKGPRCMYPCQNEHVLWHRQTQAYFTVHAIKGIRDDSGNRVKDNSDWGTVYFNPCNDGRDPENEREEVPSAQFAGILTGHVLGT